MEPIDILTYMGIAMAGCALILFLMILIQVARRIMTILVPLAKIPTSKKTLVKNIEPKPKQTKVI